MLLRAGADPNRGDVSMMQALPTHLAFISSRFLKHYLSEGGKKGMAQLRSSLLHCNHFECPRRVLSVYACATAPDVDIRGYLCK